jgi:integrase/recombinase XerC/integrase/recombinase XerD
MAETQTRKATVWLKPDQVDELRNAITAVSSNPLRDESIVQVLYDTGLRVSEATGLTCGMVSVETGDEHIALPGSIQKDYPIEGVSPSYTEISLAPETARLLRTYLSTRDGSDESPLWASREGGHLSPEHVRENIVRRAAREAEVEPYTTGRDRGSPEQVTPHVLRHSVAYRMVAVEGATIYDVKQRLRHARLSTTDRVYSHFDRV